MKRSKAALVIMIALSLVIVSRISSAGDKAQPAPRASCVAAGPVRASVVNRLAKAEDYALRAAAVMGRLEPDSRGYHHGTAELCYANMRLLEDAYELYALDAGSSSEARLSSSALVEKGIIKCAPECHFAPGLPYSLEIKSGTLEITCPGHKRSYKHDEITAIFEDLKRQ